MFINGFGLHQFQPSVTPTKPTSPPPDGVIPYTVRSGETLPELSIRYGLTLQQMLAANPQLRDPDELTPGQAISIPVMDNGGKLPIEVQVQMGESLTQISRLYGVSLNTLAGANGIRNQNFLYPGEALWAPVSSNEVAVPSGVSLNSLQPYIASVDAAVKQYDSAGGNPQAQSSALTELTDAVEKEIEARVILEVPSGQVPGNALLTNLGTAIASRYGSDAGLDRAIQQGVSNAGAAADVNDAVAQVNTAQQALSTAEPTATAAQLKKLRQNLTSAQNNLQSQIQAEIYTRSQTPAGQIPDAAVVQEYSVVISQRFSGNPAALNSVNTALTDVSADFQAEAVVSAADAATDPLRALAILNKGYAAASPAVQKLILANANAQAILSSAADQATAPLGEVKPNDRDFYGPIGVLEQALQNLNLSAAQLDPTIAAALLGDALPRISRYNADYAAANGGQSLTANVLHTGPATVGTVMSLSGLVAGTPQGDQDIAALAKLGFWDNNTVSNALASGASAAYPEAIAHLAQAGGQDPTNVISIIQQGVLADEQRVQGDVKALGQYDETLSWLTNTFSGSMTAAQLQNAVTNYESANGWQSQNTKLTRQLITDATTLTQNLKILGSLAQQDPQTAGTLDLSSTIAAAYNNTATSYGLTLVAGENPNLYTDSQGQSFLTLVSGLKLADQGRKVTQLIGSLVVRSMVVKAFNGVTSLSQAEEAIEALKSPFLSNWMGVNDNSVWNSALKILQKNLAGGNDDPAAIETKLQNMDQELNKLKALSSSTPAGQLLRTIGVAYAFANTVNSAQKFAAAQGAPDKTIDGLQTLAAFAGLTQKATGLANGLKFEFVTSKPLMVSFAKDTANGTISLFGGALDLVDAVRSYSGWGEPQNTADGVFSTLSGAGGMAYGASQFAETGIFDSFSDSVFGVAGGTFAAGLGIAGVGVVAVGILGEALYDKAESDHQYQGVSKSFLEDGGYSPAAAGALSNQDGLLSGAGGSSGVPFLDRYADMKHLTTDQLQEWVNSLTSAQVNTLDQRLLQTAGDSGGNPQQFTNGPLQTRVIVDPGSGWATPITLSDTLQAFESNLKAGGVPLPSGNS